ncbi:hypothetical protein V8C35DRAFT_279445 [Trichoderma chlorosporum]
MEFPSTPPPSPVHSTGEHPYIPMDAAYGRRASVQSTTTMETETTTGPPPTAASVAPNLDSKVDDVDQVAEQGKHQEWNENNDSLPSFFSGVGVGLCLLLQIFHILLRLLLEMAQKMGKQGMW